MAGHTRPVSHAARAQTDRPPPVPCLLSPRSGFMPWLPNGKESDGLFMIDHHTVKFDTHKAETWVLPRSGCAGIAC